MLPLVFTLLVSVAIADTTQGNLLPQPSYIRTLQPDDTFNDAFCVENGEAATIQTGYQAFQACHKAQIASVWAGVPGSYYIGISRINSAAAVNLGTLSGLAAKYNISMDYGTIWASIHYDPSYPTPSIVIMKSLTDGVMSFQPLNASDVAELQTTTLANIQPIQNNVYIVRVTDSATTSWTNTDLYYKLITETSTVPYVVRWTLFYSRDDLQPYSAPTDDSSTSSDSVGEAALGLAVITFVLVLIYFVYLFHTRCHTRHLKGAEGQMLVSSSANY